MIGVTYNHMLGLTITHTLYMIFLLGLLMIFAKEIQVLGKQIKRKWQLTRRSAKAKRNTIIQVSALLALVSFAIAIGQFNMNQSLILSLGIGGVPVIVSRYRKEKNRKGSMDESTVFISSLMNEYRIKNGNILEAMESLVLHSKDLKVTKQATVKLLAGFRGAKNDKQKRELTEMFSQEIGAEWGKLIAKNIYIAESQGLNIELSLEDIFENAKDMKTMAEERKRLNAESVRMVKYLVPIAYLGSIFACVKYMGMGLDKVISNQFGTKEGLFMLIIMGIVFLVNIMLVEAVRNKRYDF